MPSRRTRFDSDDEEQCSCGRCNDPSTTADAVRFHEFGCPRNMYDIDEEQAKRTERAKPKVKVPTKPKKKPSTQSNKEQRAQN
jgi:hypothetical protein